MGNLVKDRHFVVRVTLEFKAIPGFVTQLAGIGEEIFRMGFFAHWNSNAIRFDFLSQDNRVEFAVSHTTVSFIARSESDWKDWRENFIAMAGKALNGYKSIESLAVKFAREDFLNVGMTFEEMVVLGFDSMLTESSKILEDANDWMVSLSKRDENNREEKISVGPLNTEMGVRQLKIAAAVSKLTEPAWGTNLSNLLAKVSGDRLWVLSEITTGDVNKHDVERVLVQAEETVERLVNQAVKRFTHVI
ncbi:hypothetical protein [Stieleria varia]|uniref:Uncharacterized protein n=1 Tax=Stieleria varia TaxID=2528005 RepID=A0A5C6B2X3_9BACT|nr:hypothetical protein [Stieleria varia]TWU06240.1 hypothetical protein Pla52n_19610 [Stieleria varia]